MGTPAEGRLIQTVASLLHDGKRGRLLNLGAGKSVGPENALAHLGCSFKCDRVDVENCTVEHPNVSACITCSAEDMSPVESESYDVVFSNYVLEHIVDIDAAIREIARVLKPQGAFVAAVPNPAAPEFVLAKHTPLWLRRWAKKAPLFETHYSYKNLGELTAHLRAAGFDIAEIFQSSCVEAFAYRRPFLRRLLSLYDKCVMASGWNRIMGDVCISAHKVRG